MIPKTTVAIPLYKSARFYDNICQNIEEELSDEVEFIVSDRHCYDDTIDRIQKRFLAKKNLHCVKANDEIDWVAHINELLKLGKGKYVRILPHDDYSQAGSLQALVDVLDAKEDAILAYSPTIAVDLNNKRLPAYDKPNPYPIEAQKQWDLSIALKMFWKGYFDGAFKGLFRRQLILNNQLKIESTRDQIFPERCWLFALALLGRFYLVDESEYVKRYHEYSTHAGWHITARHYLSAAHTMSSYLRDIVGENDIWMYGNRDIWYNAIRKTRNLTEKGTEFTYIPAPQLITRNFRETILPYNL